MTRTSMNRTLRTTYVVLAAVLIISVLARLANHIPGLAGTSYAGLALAIYDYMKDMALIFVTVVAAYLANVFQKRSNFVHSLETEWRNIVKTKSALFAYCEKQNPTHDDYLAAFCRISETIDNMRIVYQNVGETDNLIGLYPYAPLHDMRRVLQWIDPKDRPHISAEERKLARDAILQSFYALRENFLEELDMEQPRHPLLISGGRRLKTPGATSSARSTQHAQANTQSKTSSSRPDIDELLQHLYGAENNAGAATMMSRAHTR